MVHNFNKKRYFVVPNMIPKYSVGDKIKVISNQHILCGRFGEIIGVFPAQRNVFYKIQINNCGKPTLPERMIEKL